MRVVSIQEPPIHEIAFLTAAPGRGGIMAQTLPIMRGIVQDLPPTVDALLLVADLQGAVKSSNPDGGYRLLGEALADELVSLSERGTIPPKDRIGVLLAGDLHPGPTLEKRGGSGDVRPVWRAFVEKFGWVAGVAGNHDKFGTAPKDLEELRRQPRVHFLDGDLADVQGLRIAGVAGIIGKPHKLWRKDEAIYVGLVGNLLDRRPDVLVLHDGPDVPASGHKGSSAIREIICLRGENLLVVRGHAYAKQPLVSLKEGVQVLNVDGRAVLLTRQ